LKKKIEDEEYEYPIRNTNPLKPEKVQKKRVTLGGLIELEDSVTTSEMIS